MCYKCTKSYHKQCVLILTVTEACKECTKLGHWYFAPLTECNKWFFGHPLCVALETLGPAILQQFWPMTMHFSNAMVKHDKHMHQIKHVARYDHRVLWFYHFTSCYWFYRRGMFHIQYNTTQKTYGYFPALKRYECLVSPWQLHVIYYW